MSSVQTMMLERTGRWKTGMNLRERRGGDVVGRKPWVSGGLIRGFYFKWPWNFLASDSLPLPRRMNNGVLSPTDIQSHIYSAFLQRRTADVALRVTGTWRAVYKLHRVVLIQSVSVHQLSPCLSKQLTRPSRGFSNLSSLLVSSSLLPTLKGQNMDAT